MNLIRTVWEFEAATGWWTVLILQDGLYSARALVLEGPPSFPGTLQIWSRTLFTKPDRNTTRLA